MDTDVSGPRHRAHPIVDALGASDRMIRIWLQMTTPSLDLAS